MSVPRETSRAHPAGRGLTYAAVHNSSEYPELPPLPPGFCWTHAEIFAPAMVCETYLDRETP